MIYIKIFFRNGYNPGDGFLFYPGSPVEIEGPIETVRLHRLRDAIEKYKYLEHLNHLYNQKGINKKCILSYLVNK